VSFQLNAGCYFANIHRKHIHIITWSQLNRPLFSQESTVCTKQDLGRVRREYICCHLLPHTHRLPSLSWCRSLCQTFELFFVEPGVKSQWTALVGYLTISPNVSCYQTRCRRQYYLPWINTAHVQFNDCCAKNLNFISPELWPQQARTELNWLLDLGSLQQREYEWQVDKIEEIKQRLVELWKSSNTTFEW